MDHFSHKHPLTLIEIEEEEEMSKSDEYRSFLRCYGCTEKIGTGVQYYRCEEGCPLFCLHHACAHLPTTIARWHSYGFCDGDLQLKKRFNGNSRKCLDCSKNWYSFAYVCSDCGHGVDIRCAMRRPNEAKHSFHQHPVQPHIFPKGGGRDLICSVCNQDMGSSFSYRCNYCNFIVHPGCTDVPMLFESPLHHPHELDLDFNYIGSKICKICKEEIDRTTQWAYTCGDCDNDYYVHAGYDGCLTSTIRKGDLQHFDHQHPLALVEEAPDDHSIAHDCNCCTQKISYVPYYTCLHCNKYHLHQLCAHLPAEIRHPLHPKGPLKLFSGLHVICDICDLKCNGFAYHCSPCNFDLDIQCVLRSAKMHKAFHRHPLFLSLTKGPFTCHACDRDNEGTSYQCIFCQFWLHEQCDVLPMLKDTSSYKNGHEHDLHLIYTIPENFSGVVVYCRICIKPLKHNRWAYHCKKCRFFTHILDCSNPQREGDRITFNPSDVVHLPLSGEPILEEKVTNGKVIKHHRHSMILFEDQFQSNNIDITPCFMNLIRGSATWPTFHVDGKDHSGFTFIFHNNTLTMSVTGVDLPCYIKHEAHPHVLESSFFNSSTWCHACEQSFFGRGFKCTTCAFTIDAYCALLPRIIKHRYDEHGFSLTYSAIEGIEEYVCEICEEDVTPRYFYHCEACDQSIHARCIWQAYVEFQPRYRFDFARSPVYLVPPSVDLPECIICHQKETFGHGFAFRGNNIMVHLTCISENDVHTY